MARTPPAKESDNCITSSLAKPLSRNATTSPLCRKARAAAASDVQAERDHTLDTVTRIVSRIKLDKKWERLCRLAKIRKSSWAGRWESER